MNASLHNITYSLLTCIGMRAIFLTIWGIAMTYNATAQQSEWLDHYPTSGSSTLGFRICPGTNGEIYGITSFTVQIVVAGDTIPALGGDTDLLLAKWDSSGTILWTHVINNSNYCAPGWGVDGPARLTYYAPQDMLLVIQSSSCQFPMDTYTSRTHLIAYTGGGDHLWTRNWGAGQNNSAGGGPAFFLNDQIISIYGAASALVSFTGTTLQLPAGYFMVQYDVNGNFLQGNSLPISAGSFGLEQRTDSTYLFTLNATPATLFFNQTLPILAANEGVILRSDTSGSIIWSKHFRSSMDCYVHYTTAALDLIATTVHYSGNLLEPGALPSTGTFSKALGILSAQGELLSLSPITSNETSIVRDLHIGADGSVYLFLEFGSEVQIGNRQFIGQASRNGLIARFNSAGECLAAWTFGKVIPSRASVMTHENAVYVSIGIDSTLTIGNDVIPLDGSEFTKEIFVAKYSAIDGFTSVSAPKTTANNQLHIYANPNDGTCTIELPQELHWTNDLMLYIHDSQGRLVQSMPLRKDQDKVTLDIRAQAKGIYPVEVTDGRQRYTGTIIFQ